jgi:hypothetical protein
VIKTSDDIQARAQETAGNWRKFDSFSWWERPKDSDNWALFPHSHRDSGLLDQANAQALQKLLEPFTEGDDPDVFFPRMNHWAVGWCDHVALRVLKDGQPTEAFREWLQIQERLENYPVLDDTLYGELEYDATVENIREVGRWAKNEVEDQGGDVLLPEDWAEQLFSHFWDGDQGQVANKDDSGGYPEQKAVEEAFEELGWVSWPEEMDGVPGPDDLTSEDGINWYQGSLVVVMTTPGRAREDIRAFFDEEQIWPRCWRKEGEKWVLFPIDD